MTKRDKKVRYCKGCRQYEGFDGFNKDGYCYACASGSRRSMVIEDENWTQRPRQYRFQHATVEVFPGSTKDFFGTEIRTWFDDGKFCLALPSFDREAFARACSLGYRDSAAGVWLMHVEHELCHTALAEAQGLRWSPCLRSHIDGPPKNGLREEAVVFLLQRAMNEGRAILPQPNAEKPTSMMTKHEDASNEIPLGEFLDTIGRNPDGSRCEDVPDDAELLINVQTLVSKHDSEGRVTVALQANGEWITVPGREEAVDPTMERVRAKLKNAQEALRVGDGKVQRIDTAIDNINSALSLLKKEEADRG